MKAKPNSRLRLLLQTMPLLNKRLPQKIGSPVEEVVILSGALRLAIPTGVLKVAPLTGPPLLPLQSPRRTPKSLPNGLTAVPGTVKRKSQTIR